MSSRIYPTLVIFVTIFLGPKSFPQSMESYLHVPPTNVKKEENVEIVILLTLDDPVLSGMLLVTAVPTLILGIYWVPIAEWIQSSLVFFIQTI